MLLDMRRVIVVCDKCESPDKEVKSYKLTSEGRVKEIDLCAEDAAPIEAFLGDAKPRGGAARAGRRRSAGTSRTKTLDEISAEKAS